MLLNVGLSSLPSATCVTNLDLWRIISPEFPGSPIVRIQQFHCHGLGLISGQWTKILKATWHSKKKKKILSFLVYNNTKTLNNWKLINWNLVALLS